MTKWLPAFAKVGTKIGVFPNLEWTMWLMTAEDLKETLEDQIEQYE
jgi:hypothetical protein